MTLEAELLALTSMADGVLGILAPRYLHKTDMLRFGNNLVLEARCAQCGKKAHVDDEMENVKCEHCGYSAKYDDYLETMKDKALLMADDFQMNWDRNPL